MTNASSFSTLTKFTSNLRQLPNILAHNITERVAPVLTQIVQRDFDSGVDPNGVPWVPGADGDRVTLRESGALARGLEYVPVGRKLRMRLAVPYAKFQVGKRRVAPGQGQPLPADYRSLLERTAVAVAREVMGR